MSFRIDELEPGLALSGAPETAPAWWLHFQAVINVCDPATPHYARSLPATVRLVHRPFEDSLPVPLPFLRAAVLELADCRAHGRSTLVHCQAGQSRSPAVVALYWMGRDRIGWDESVRRVRASRPRVDPHPRLVGGRAQQRVAEEVRAFLSGRSRVLDCARADADALLGAHAARGAPGRSGPGWVEVEPGLACGTAARAPEFERVLDLAAGNYPGLREDAPVDPGACRRAVDQLLLWRSEDRAVLVRCGSGKSLSVLVVALGLMATRGWDFPTAMWYIRQRLPGAWPHPECCRGLAVLSDGDSAEPTPNPAG
jgi:protein-tyrosine phosphatase